MNFQAIISGLFQSIAAFFQSEEFWKVRGSRLELKDKKLELNRVVIEKENEQKILIIDQKIQDMKFNEYTDLEIENKVSKMVSKLDFEIPKRKLKRIKRRIKRKI